MSGKIIIIAGKAQKLIDLGGTGMNRKSIEHAKDPDLRGSVAAIRRAAKRARLVALNTGTRLVVWRNGNIKFITPTAQKSNKPKRAVGPRSA